MSSTIVTIIEIAGTMAFAISGIRLAASKRFDLFGAYVVGLVTAIGGGTIRDIMLGITPFWMEREIYLTTTAVTLLLVIILGRHLLHFKNTFLIFDTIGLALFTIVGLTKSLSAGFPMWVAITMGIVTGSFGGVMRDILVGDTPLLFKRDIYAVSSLIGGGLFAILLHYDVSEASCSMLSIGMIILIRIVAVRFHIHLPQLTNDERDDSTHIIIQSPKEKK